MGVTAHNERHEVRMGPMKRLAVLVLLAATTAGCQLLPWLGTGGVFRLPSRHRDVRLRQWLPRLHRVAGHPPSRLARTRPLGTGQSRPRLPTGPEPERHEQVARLGLGSRRS